MKKVIVISAHPDDETLGCGGTLLKHKAAGDEIAWLITTGMRAELGFSAERIQQRDQEIDQVAEAYGMKKVYKLNYPTTQLTYTTQLKMIPDVSKVFQEFQPEIIYVLNRSDAHSDHKFTFEAVAACTKSFRYPSIRKVLMYECISETEFAPALPEKVFIPNYFVDISEHFEQKCEIMKIFESELGEHPFPRSLRNIEALATFRGASVGVEYAEAFQVVKIIDA